jgi:hypothetical protein
MDLSDRPADSEDESSNEARIVSFIVRVWREEPVTKKHQAIWRGHITPIPNGKRLYFKNIYEIPDLITAYLKIQKQAL